jgi:hypothetical protein
VKKNNCKVKNPLGCNNQCVQLLTGRKKTDPKFYCCIGCRAILNRMGVKLKEVTK